MRISKDYYWNYCYSKDRKPKKIRFVKIERKTTEDKWVAKYPNGLVTVFGGTEDSKDHLNGNESFSWKISQTYDEFNHKVNYKYEKIEGQLYIKEIIYKDYPEDQSKEYVNKILFDYENRSDPVIKYNSGHRVKITKRLKRITVTQGKRHLWSYFFFYSSYFFI